MGKVNIDFTPTKYNPDDAPDLVTGAYNQSMDDLKTALDNATAEDSGGGGGITYPIPIDKGGTNATTDKEARYNLMSSVPKDNAETVLSDSNEWMSTYPSPSKTDGYLIRRPLTSLWNYINRKADSLYAKISDLAGYLPLTGGTLTGDLTVKNSNHPPQLNVLNGIGKQSSIQTNNNNCKLFFVDPEAGGIQNSLYLYSDRTELRRPLTLASIADAILEARKTVELTINIVDNEGEIDGHQIPKSEGTIIPLCVHGKHTATPVVFGFDVDEDDTNYLLYIYAQTKSQVDSITVVFEYLVL